LGIEMSTVRLWLPEGMEQDIDAAMDSAGKSKLVKYAKWFVSTVVGRVKKERDTDRFNELGVNYLHVGLQKDHVAPIKKALIPALIETDVRYCEGEKSLGYRLSPAYRDRTVHPP